MFNVECAVRPPSSGRSATAEEATAKTLFSYDFEKR